MTTPIDHQSSTETPIYASKPHKSSDSRLDRATPGSTSDGPVEIVPRSDVTDSFIRRSPVHHLLITQSGQLQKLEDCRKSSCEALASFRPRIVGFIADRESFPVEDAACWVSRVNVLFANEMGKPLAFVFHNEPQYEVSHLMCLIGAIGVNLGHPGTLVDGKLVTPEMYLQEHLELLAAPVPDPVPIRPDEATIRRNAVIPQILDKATLAAFGIRFSEDDRVE